MKKKLLLINPRNSYKAGIYHEGDFSVPPMGLGIIAALTDSDWEIEILDESFDVFQVKKADLVGFTGLTSQATRAYELASIYRELNIPTVMGGIHASMLPEEALKYVDVVVKGEAEGVWRELLHDFKQGSLRKIYESELQDLYTMPPPRIDLYSPKYAFGSLQTTRGCPMKCDFCSVHTFNGRKYRYRNVAEVVDEYKRIPQKSLYIIDDDFFGYGSNTLNAPKIFVGVLLRAVLKRNGTPFVQCTWPPMRKP